MPPRQRQRRPYHHGDLRRTLLDATIALVADAGGTGEVTLREAARRAGVSHAAPYRHFSDKGQLLAAVAAEGFDDLTRQLRAARGAARDDEERFVRTGLAYLRFAEERPGHMRVMFELPKSTTAALQKAANETFQVLKELAGDAGVTHLETSRRLGTIVWSFVHGLCVLSGRGQVPPSVGASREELAELGLRHLFRSFRTP